ITSTASGLCWRNAGRSTWARKAQNTSASVAASMLMAARMPSVPSAPRTVSRLQWLQGMVAMGAGALEAPGVGANHIREGCALIEENQTLRGNRVNLAAPLPPRLGDRRLVLLGGPQGLLFSASAASAKAPGPPSRDERRSRPPAQAAPGIAPASDDCRSRPSA